MSNRSLDILNSLMEKREEIKKENKSRVTRPKNLLIDRSSNDANGWYFFIPDCFNDALDIKKTERVNNGKTNKIFTQGYYFSFGAGDTLFDNCKAYNSWETALESMTHCVQVKTAQNATVSSTGSVTFSVFKPDDSRSKLIEHGEHTMSQDEFVKYLILGPSNELKV